MKSLKRGLTVIELTTSIVILCLIIASLIYMFSDSFRAALSKRKVALINKHLKQIANVWESHVGLKDFDANDPLTIGPIVPSNSDDFLDKLNSQAGFIIPEPPLEAVDSSCANSVFGSDKSKYQVSLDTLSPTLEEGNKTLNTERLDIGVHGWDNVTAFKRTVADRLVHVQCVSQDVCRQYNKDVRPEIGTIIPLSYKHPSTGSDAYLFTYYGGAVCYGDSSNYRIIYVAN